MKLKWFNQIDEYVAEERGKNYGNPYYTIDDLPLTPQQKKCVIEYLARKLWGLLIDLGISDGHCKSYDPLVIGDGIAYSYVFDMEDGGRQHKYRNLRHLEEMLYKETLEAIKDEMDYWMSKKDKRR